MARAATTRPTDRPAVGARERVGHRLHACAQAGRVFGLAAALLAANPFVQFVQARSFVPDEAPSCSPPAMVDLSLERVDPPGQPAWAGSTGALSLKATWCGGSMRPFAIAHDLEPLPHGDQQTLRLEPLDTSPCLFFEYVGPGPFPGLYGLYYYLQGELRDTPGLAATCQLRYHVLPAARLPDQVRFRVHPVGCAADPNQADNFVEFAFGGPAPAAPVPGPGRGWLLLAAVFVLLIACWHRAARSSMIASSRSGTADRRGGAGFDGNPGEPR